MKEKVFTVQTPSDFTSVIEYILENNEGDSKKATIITLSGDLGAGKTTFAQHLADKLLIKEVVVSPTFGIMKMYEIEGHTEFDRFVHIDAYRIEDISETGPLRFEEIFETERTLVCVEWPEQIKEVLPSDVIKVSISITDNDIRTVIVS